MSNIEEKNKKYYKLIYSYLKQLNENRVSPVNLYEKLGKKNIPSIFISSVILDFLVENDINNSEIINLVFTVGVEEMGKALKIESEALKFFKIYRSFGGTLSKSYLYDIIPYTGYDINYLLLLDNNIYTPQDISSVNIRHILENVEKFGYGFKDKKIIKFLHYLFSMEEIPKVLHKFILPYFHLFSLSLQKFLINVSHLFWYTSQDYVINYLTPNDHYKLDLSVVRDIIKSKYEFKKTNESPYYLTKLYITMDENYKKVVFKDDLHFLRWLYTFNVDEIINLLNQNLFNQTWTNKFFDTFPNFIKRVNKEGDMDELIKLKFIRGIPTEISKEIKIPLKIEGVIFDGNDILNMIQKNDYSDYVKKFVDDTLFESTMDWYYDTDESSIRQYYWEYIDEKNMELIKSKILENDPEIDMEDEDAIQDAAFDDDDIKSALHIGAEDGQRFGDESELYKDCENVINELFGVGEWVRTETNYNTIITNISLENFDYGLMIDGYEDNGEWDVKYIFIYCMKEKSNRDKPGLPEYRYGISGNFDEKIFNETILEYL